MLGSRKDNTEPLGKPKAAIEIMVLNPDPAVHHNNKSVHENLWIKERYGKDNYLSIGVLLKESTLELQFYFFEDCDKPPNPQFFSSLKELQKHLPPEKKDIFDRTQKVYLMGHGDAESKYGFGNYHAHDDFSQPPSDTEQIYDDKFDELIVDILRILPTQHDEIGITLEECHTDNLVTAEKVGQTKSFLERLSAKYPHLTFSGTGPWSDSRDLKESLGTSARASGGYPHLNAPITSMGGNVWKHGDTVAFYNEFKINGDDTDYQVVAKKTKFASTQTAKELKINTVNYAAKILENAPLDLNAKKEILKNISGDSDILKIDDLKKHPYFKIEKSEITGLAKWLAVHEKEILEKEKDNYIHLVKEILVKREKVDSRDLLELALGLKDYAEKGSIEGSVFEGHDKLLSDILDNKQLLNLVMVTSGKVLIATPSNDSLIDLLRSKNINVNSVDEHGMTALHYAVQNFYVYRDEPLKLIKKLLDCGANVKIADEKGQTPLAIAMEHGSKGMVMEGQKLIELIQTKLPAATPDAEVREAALPRPK